MSVIKTSTFSTFILGALFVSACGVPDEQIGASAQALTSDRNRDVKAPLQAESADVSSGVVIWPLGLSYIEDGDYVAYNHVDFGAGVAARVFSTNMAMPNNNNVMELRLDEPDGPLLGRLVTRSTGSDFDTYAIRHGALEDISEVKGLHDLYITFDGSANYQRCMDSCWAQNALDCPSAMLEGCGDGIGNFDWIFLGDSCQANEPFVHGDECVASCPTDAPLSHNGVCVAECPAAAPLAASGACVAACPATSPLLYDGQCISACPPAAPLSVDGTCAAACPASKPLREGSSCVSLCSTSSPISHDGQCLNKCPPGLTQEGSTCSNTAPNTGPTLCNGVPIAAGECCPSAADLALAETKTCTAAVCDYSRGCFRNADLTGLIINAGSVSFAGADLSGANFFASRIISTGAVRFVGAKLERASLSAMQIKADQLSFEGVSARGLVISGSQFSATSAISFYGANVDEAKWGGALFSARTGFDFRRATFRNAIINQSSFTGGVISMQNTKFDGASLVGTTFSGANFEMDQGTSFCDAVMTSTRFTAPNYTPVFACVP